MNALQDLAVEAVRVRLEFGPLQITTDNPQHVAVLNPQRNIRFGTVEWAPPYGWLVRVAVVGTKRGTEWSDRPNGARFKTRYKAIEQFIRKFDLTKREAALKQGLP